MEKNDEREGVRAVTRQEINEAIRRNTQRIAGLAQDLVRINSENHPPGGNEGEIQDYIAGFWRDHGIECESFTPSEVQGFAAHPAYHDSGRSYEGRPVVVARLPGSGGGRSLILSGHVDTVPVGPGEWRHQPFSGAIENGRLYGRGAFDMKGGIAVMMMAACTLHEMGVRLKGDLFVETVPDEEFASGNGTVAARARGYMADSAVIAEPSGLNIVAGHRGFRLARIAIAGRTGIPVLGEEMTNPVQHLTPVLEGIEDFRRARAAVTVEDTVMITKLAANSFREDELLTVPPQCRIEVYWQLMPEEYIAGVDAQFEAAIEAACAADAYFSERPARITYHLRAMPGSRVPEDAAIVQEMCAAVEWVTGKPANVLTAFPPCDLFVFNRFCGIPAIVFGPGGGGAHAPDEYVLVDDLVKCAEVYAILAAKESLD